MSFDFGATPVSAGGNFKNPEVGKHAARLKAVLHLGMVADIFKDKKTGKEVKKDPAPFVLAVFELKEDSDKNEDGSFLTSNMYFPLKTGEKAKLTAFMKTMLTAEENAQYEAGTLKGGFDMLIGRPVELDLEGGKDKNDDGTPKYVNIKTLSKLHPKLAALVDDLSEVGAHVKFQDHTVETIKQIPAYLVPSHVMKAVNYPGSAAERAVAAILAEDKDYFTFKKKEEEGGESAKDDVAPPADMTEDQEY